MMAPDKRRKHSAQQSQKLNSMALNEFSCKQFDSNDQAASRSDTVIDNRQAKSSNRSQEECKHYIRRPIRNNYNVLVLSQQQSAQSIATTATRSTTTTTTLTTTTTMLRQRRRCVQLHQRSLRIPVACIADNQQSSDILMRNRPISLFALLCSSFALVCLAATLLPTGSIGGRVEARVTFEKMTNRDFSGIAYYTIQNVSLFECLGWCKEEQSCTSAVFSFVVNPFAALQETTCVLQNETQARQGAYLRNNGGQVSLGGGSDNNGGGGGGSLAVAQPQKATNLYFFNKIELPTESVCSRLWAFERFPNRRLRQRDRQSFHAGSKEACQAACMSDSRFVCRSLEYNYITQQCTLSQHDRRSPLVQHLAQQVPSISSASNNDLIETPATDYFENACLLGEDICNESRIYDYPKVGLPLQRVAHFVELNYYPDKEMLVKSQAGCVRACTIEHEFICRSILYRSSFKQGQPNCALYHLDQRTFPEGADAFMGHTMQPLLDSGETSAVYLEAICNDSLPASVLQPTSQSMSMMTTTSSVGLLSGQQSQQSTMTMPPTSITIMPSSSTPGGVHVVHSHQRESQQQQQQREQQQSTTLATTSATGSGLSGHYNTSSNDAHERFQVQLSGGSSTSSQGLSAMASTLSPLLGGPPTTIRLPAPFLPGNPPATIHITGESGPSTVSAQRPYTARPPQNILISPAPPPGSQSRDPMSGGGLIDPNASHMQITTSNGPASHDQNCDAHGFCYDVALKCTDTKMVVNVKTQRPFFGRIYALGRSETCNANIKNQNQFQLDMYLTGQECNTQSASGTYTNTIVIQHHNVVLTKADKVYHVRCTYETASRNVSFGMMPVKDMFEVDVNDRNQETISITASSDAPLPKISILTLDGKEASTVRIGDRLTFRIEIPDNTPYGIFARSCSAMAKDGRSTFEIIDEHGCPVDHTIFPNFLPASNGNILESNYEAFRFTESYGVIFQCNVKYCIGKCEPVNCGIGRDSVESWGRRKRSIGSSSSKGSSDGEEKDHRGHSKKKMGATGKALRDDMTLSREIVVLDLKEKDENGGSLDASEYASLTDSSGSSGGDGNGSTGTQRSRSSFVDNNNLLANDASETTNNGAIADSQESLLSQRTNQHCISGQSLFVLICSIGLFSVIYICVVAYFFARRHPKISPIIKNQFH